MKEITDKTEGTNSQIHQQMEILTTYSTIDQKPKQKVSKDIGDLNNMITYYDLINIYKTNHPIAAKYTFPLTTDRILKI